MAQKPFSFSGLLRTGSAVVPGRTGSKGAIGGRTIRKINLDQIGALGRVRNPCRLARRGPLKVPRRNFLHLAAVAAALPALSRIATAQTYPSRPVRIIVGFPPAGATDITARLIGQWLSERLGQQFVIESRPGAGGNLATEAVAKASPDGYTLLLTGSNDTWNRTLYGNLKFDYIHDILPVASVSRGMGVLVVHPSVPANSVSELLVYAKANPGKLTVASSGVGSAPHMFWELFRSMTGVNMLHVPYRGGGPALIDLLGGQVQAYFSTIISAIQYIRDCKLRPLAVTGSTRADVLPDIPTVGDFVRGYEASIWLGVGAPKNTPTQIVDTLHTEINNGLADVGLKRRFAELGDAVFASSPAGLANLIVEDTEKWAKVIKSAGIRAN
jgi:tripartite-type tricarboxylate transporter receptor subunit TctC